MKKRFLALLLVTGVLVSLAVAGCAAPQTADTAIHEDSDAVNAKYLEYYFHTTLPDPVTAGDFAAALAAVQPVQDVVEIVPADAAASLTGCDAVKYTVQGAGLEELALVYTEAKIKAALGGVAVDGAYAAYFACALDLGLITPERAAALSKNGPTEVALANRLLMAAATCNGTARNMMGYADDPETSARVMNMWNAIQAANDPASLCEDETLVSVGVASLLDGTTTGFNIVDVSRDGRFLPELTINYFHDNIRHVRQILGLLESEGYECKVQVNPEFSVYQYLPEWNDDEPNPTYKVVQAADDFYLVYTIGYFLELEFSNAEDRLAFDQLVKDVAKKNSGEEGKALLYQSWWQPTYESYVKVDDSYYEIYDQTVTHNNYVMRVGTLDDILPGLQALAKDGCTVAQTTYWINDAYWRYMNGEAE